MKCPYCSTSETKVVDSRINQTADIIRRRRECPSCQSRFTTYERVEELMPLVIKKDGRREPYSRAKVLEGINKACQKRSVPALKIEEAINRIERKIQSFGLKEIPSYSVGAMVMSELHQLDKVAYVRFASVYRKFKDVEEFVTEIREPPTGSADQDPTLLSFPFASKEPTA